MPQPARGQSDGGSTIPRNEPAGAALKLTAGFAATFWIAVAGTVALALVLALWPRSLEFDLGSAPHIARAGENTYRADFGRSIPDDCVLRQKGRELMRVDNADSVAGRDGQYFFDAPSGIVVWSSVEDSLARKQRFSYTLTAHPWGRPALRKRALLLLFPAIAVAVCGAFVVMLKRRAGYAVESRPEKAGKTIAHRLIGSIEHTGSSSTRARVGLVVACAVCLTAALVPGWNRLVSAPDSNSYVTHSEMRTPLVPYWIDAFDRRSEIDRAPDLFDELGVVNHWGGSHRFIWSLRAWKLLLVASVCLLVWQLSVFTNWWLVGATVCSAAAFDVALGPWSRGMTGYLDVVLSEGMSHALTFLCLALVAGYLNRPGWTRGILVALCVNLLLLTRPGNVPFLAVFGVIWLFHLRRDTLRFATLRSGALAAVTTAGILLHCSTNYAAHGHFKQHAFTGFNLMTTAMQVATPEDAALFDEPQLQEFVRVCTVEFADRRSPELTDAAATQNCWQLACPAYAKVFGETVFVDPYKADAVFTKVARGVLKQHAAEFTAQVARSFWRGFWTTWLHVPLLVVIALSLRAFVRTGAWPSLFLAWFAALPFLTVGPCCLTNTPLDRYRSQTYFAELWTVPLGIALVVSNWSKRRGSSNSENQDRTEEETPTDCQARSPVILRSSRRMPASQRS